MSVNVQSLATVDSVPRPEEDDAFAGRAAYLRKQCRHHGVHALAVQESRSKVTATVQSHSHIGLCSGSDAQGHHGVELWFDEQLPISSGAHDSIRVQLSDLLDPRMLIVRLSRRGLHILFVVVHAPLATSPIRDAWWQDLAARVTRCRRGCWVVLIGDFNVHFAEAIPYRVGDLVWPGSGSVPAGLASLLARHDLWIPSTFKSCHVGPSETWFTPNGLHGARIDFIAVPASGVSSPGGSQVHHDLDWGQGHVDHYPIRLDISFWESCMWPSSQKSVSVDRDAMETEEGRAALRRIWDSAPLPPWDTNVHRHWDAVEQHLQCELVRVFPARRGSCRTSFFSVGTWLVRQRWVWLRRQLLRLRQRLVLLELRAGWSVWAGCLSCVETACQCCL